MIKKWFVLVNPAAGGFRAGRLWPTISKLLEDKSIEFEYKCSKSSLDAVELVASAIDLGFRYFIAVGGDGTLNLLVNGVFKQTKVSPENITIALIPVGTGNDWIRSKGIPRSVSGAIELIFRSKSGFQDIGRIDLTNTAVPVTKYFINMAGFGFQGLIASRIEGVSSNIKKGTFAFVLGILDALFRYKISIVNVSSKHFKLDDKIYNISIGIGNYCGGGMKMAPEAITNDGFFDVTMVKNISKAEVIINLPGLFSGNFVKHRKVVQHRTQRLKIESFPLLPIECDGEVVGFGNADVEIINNAIRVIVP